MARFPNRAKTVKHSISNWLWQSWHYGGTGNFNISLVKDQNPTMNYGITLLPGAKPGQVSSFAGGDIVTIPNGSKRVDDAVDFMKWLLSDDTQLEGYAKNLDLTTRGDMADNKYFKETPAVRCRQGSGRGQHALYLDKFFELINSPQGPWLQMLQRPMTRTRISIRSLPMATSIREQS